MIKWAIYDNSGETDIQVRKFGFQNTKVWFRELLKDLTPKCRKHFRQSTGCISTTGRA
jgi:hypothetical protein